MASKVREDEKNERIIRGLLKLPENRRCVNCNSLGPQYVCTNFWIFVCTTCSGIHREFTHRVKSISMAKFSSQEVAALQGGGNQHAREIYLKEWDAQRQSFPDGSNVERLRDFIKHVYVDKRYTGERSVDKPLRPRTGDKDDFYESRRADSSQSGSRSPYEDTYDRRYSERSSPGGRSDDRNSRDTYDGRKSPAAYEQEPRQYGDHRRSPIHSGVINDWRREDRFGSERRHEDLRASVGDSKLEGRSPERLKDSKVPSPPVVRPVRDILGENVTPLRIEPPKATAGRASDGFAQTQTQRTASSCSLGSTNGNIVDPKTDSLIDFDVDPGPPVSAAAPPQAHQAITVQTIPEPLASSSNENWASFDSAPVTKVSQASAPVNTLESLLTQLSAPASVPVHTSGISPTPGALTTEATVSASNFSAFPPSGAPAATLVSQLPSSDNNAFVKATDVGQWPNIQHQRHNSFPGTGNQPAAQQFTPFGGTLSNQPWNSAHASSTQGMLPTPGAQVSQAVPKFSQEINPISSQSLPAESNLGGRKALPEDLFAVNYSSFPVPTPGWQTGPPHGMGFAMPYNAAAAMPTFPQLPRSTNPFDFNVEPHQAQASTFPSMAPLQGALPHMAPPAATSSQQIASTGSLPTAWMPNQSPSYASSLPPHGTSFISAVPPRPYIGQQVHSGMPAASGGPAFGSSPNPQLTRSYLTPTTPNPSSSAGGNPFA